MPVIRCPKCGQAYDIPGVVAARLPNSIATCHCGEWIAGSKAAVLARMLDPAKIKEVDLQPYRIDEATADAKDSGAQESGGSVPAHASRSIRIVALGADQALDTTFTLSRAPLVIGRRGAHIDLPDAGLSLRHCTISLRGNEIVLRDADSNSGTFLDGKKIDEVVINDGVHLLQIGTARLAVEPTDEPGTPIESLPNQTIEADESEMLAEVAAAQPPEPPAPPPPPPPAQPVARTFLVCVEGPLNGQEFEVPPAGLTVGREGHVRVPDEFLSRKHFQVTPDSEGAIRVKDLGSRNGTFLNTAPAQDSVVNPGDEIRAGVNAFRIEHRK
jgi:pSer/pThr/pTyr-binding forkhead associated (FHA) protein